ncbi:MAG: ATP-binding cassette domain-containing protein, partial [Dehalococcoidia bacterium]
MTPALTYQAGLALGGFEYEAAFEADSEVVVLFGHSGAGKSITLQAIAGLLCPDAGRVTIDGRPVFDATRGIDVPPQGRGVGYVVQELALFPHLTVAENVGFGVRGSRAERHARAQPLLGRLGIGDLAWRMPGSLSGGQRQRV